jgi:N-acetylmuramoyl-L-alanine amidase
MSKKQATFILLFIAASYCGYTQKKDKPVIRLVTPSSATANVSTPKQFITGTTGTDCQFTINGNPVKVFSTGAFAYTAALKEGQNTFLLKSDNGKKTTEQNIVFNYQPAPPQKPTDSFAIDQVTVEPAGDLALPAGETIKIRVKAKPGCKVMLNYKYNMPELPASQTRGMTGIYQLVYRFKEEDSLLLERLSISLSKNERLYAEMKTKARYTVLPAGAETYGRTKSPFTPVYSGLGEDRLGGTKAGFLDSGVVVQTAGRIGNLYKVKLNQSMHVYVPEDLVQPLPEGTAPPQSLTNNLRVVGDSLYDYVQLELFNKLPYLSYQEISPSKIIVDVYGATANTNWLMQFPETLQEITDVYYKQVENNLLRVTINLKHKQHWGYYTYYNGNTLIIKIRRQKEQLQLSNMVIGLDAGHGGSNRGAEGITGRLEKEFTLAIAKKLKQVLQNDSAVVIMTRESDISFENNDRLIMLRKRNPDFVLSIHLNSAGDPLRVKGTSTYYKHIGFKKLSGYIYKRMKETGLPGWGHIGNFNFFLNSATEFPSALVETLFISSPEEEEKVFSADFQQLMAEKIAVGIKDWLLECMKDQ